MERAGPQRTCLQGPHGGCETLSVRSDLTVRSCQRPQGREGLLAQRALPSTHTCGMRGGDPGGHERDHLFPYMYPAMHEDGALTQA